MFDPYAQMRDHARKMAYFHPAKLTTWTDAVKANHDADLDIRFENPLSVLLPYSLKGLVTPLLILSLVVILFLSTCTAPQPQPTPDTLPTDISEADMPNPASAFCEEQGYWVEIRIAQNGSQAGY